MMVKLIGQAVSIMSNTAVKVKNRKRRAGERQICHDLRINVKSLLQFPMAASLIGRCDASRFEVRLTHILSQTLDLTVAIGLY